MTLQPWQADLLNQLLGSASKPGGIPFDFRSPIPPTPQPKRGPLPEKGPLQPKKPFKVAETTADVDRVVNTQGEVVREDPAPKQITDAYGRAITFAGSAVPPLDPANKVPSAYLYGNPSYGSGVVGAGGGAGKLERGKSYTMDEIQRALGGRWTLRGETMPTATLRTWLPGDEPTSPPAPEPPKGRFQNLDW